MDSRVCLSPGHRRWFEKTGERCTCRKYVPAEDYDALAAHVERMHRLWLATDDCEEGSEEQLTLFGELDEAVRGFSNNPTTSLARRDAHTQWETCERLAAALRLHGLAEAEGLVDAIGERVKRQAEEI